MLNLFWCDMGVVRDKYWAAINLVGFYFLIFYLLLFVVCAYLIFKMKIKMWIRILIFLGYVPIYAITFGYLVNLLIHDC